MGPLLGDRLEIAGVTVKLLPLLAKPPIVTTTFPVVAAGGTVTSIAFATQFVTFAGVPLNVTVLLPCVEPKVVPLRVTAVPTAPCVGDKLWIAGVTVKFTPLLTLAPTFTFTLPVVAPVGTEVSIEVLLQLVTVAIFPPLNVTVLEPCVAPNAVPVIVTAAPIGPEMAERLKIPGVTVNATPFDVKPPTVTITFPVVAPAGTATCIAFAPQAVGVAVVPLKVTVLVPCVYPKVVPLTVRAVPSGPEVTERLLIAGVTVKSTPLLF
ncbi:MAG TPA: hypothetical protein VHW45_06270 [Candidatus Sulfotelmatobacter sp.]|nr:hypothetical protein [Candidatus Sulfotelmatobacter sp.]